MALRTSSFVALSKPRITLMVVLTALLSFAFARSVTPPVAPAAATSGVLLLIGLSVGTALLSAGASAFNMWLERELDARMDRTKGRPLPAGDLAPVTVIGFALLLAALGTATLAVLVNGLCAILGALTFATYVLIYTPLKTRTHWAAHVGTVPGALPVLMGWVAARGAIEAPGLALFGILLLWQLPHFFAINWMYKEEYRDAGFRMIATADTSGRRLAIESVLFTIGLLLVSLAPPLLRNTGWLYQVSALVMGGIFLFYVVRFSRERSVETARSAMFASIVYLPSVFVALLVDRLLMAPGF